MERVPCNPVPDSPIKSVTEARAVLVPGLVDGAAGVLRSQGCEIISGKGSENVIINYPPGSTRQKLLASTPDARYRVKLPNGCELREIEEKGQTCMRLYMVRKGLEAKG